MTPKMVAERWHCSEKHVRKLIATGQLPHFKAVGKLIRLLKTEVEAFERQSTDVHATTPEFDTAIQKQQRRSRLDMRALRNRRDGGKAP